MNSTGRFLRILGIAVKIVVIGVVVAGEQAHTGELSVWGYSPVSVKRVGRTIFQFTFAAKLTNSGTCDFTCIKAKVKSASPHTEIVDGELSFAVAASGNTVSATDTFSFNHDRRFPFNYENLIWSFSAPGSVPGPAAPAAELSSDYLHSPGMVCQAKSCAQGLRASIPLNFSIKPGAVASTTQPLFFPVSNSARFEGKNASNFSLACSGQMYFKPTVLPAPYSS